MVVCEVIAAVQYMHVLRQLRRGFCTIVLHYFSTALCACMQHMTDVYHRSIEKLISYCQENKTNTVEISSDFLCPLVEWVKVIQYGNEAVIEVGGQQLWFVHSMKLLSIIKDPVQVKEVSINFKTSMDKIPRDQRESEIVIFSYFYRPVRQKVKVQIEVSIKL